jgi:NADPH-dependent curcumin reductase CurA
MKHLEMTWDPPPQGPRVERHLLVKRARMSGLLIFEYAPRFEEAISRLASWVREGKLRYREDIQEGMSVAQARSPSFIEARTCASG